MEHSSYRLHWGYTVAIPIVGLILIVLSFVAEHDSATKIKQTLTELAELQQQFYQDHGRYAGNFAELSDSIKLDPRYSYVLYGDDSTFSCTMLDYHEYLLRVQVGILDQTGIKALDDSELSSTGRVVWLPNANNKFDCR